MNEGTLISGGEVVIPSGVVRADIFVQDGKIGAIAPDLHLAPSDVRQTIDANAQLVVPGLIDLHTHGCRNFSTMSGDAEAIVKVAEHLAVNGVTTFYPTVAGKSLEHLLRNFEAVKEAMAQEIHGAQILGIHCEGPYLSPISPARGAIAEGWLRKPDRGEVKELIAAADGALRLMCVAPELPGAKGVIEELLSAGVTVAIGHSNATCEEAIRGFDWGIRHATHTFNGMRRMHHREPGVVGAILTDDRIWAEVIADGVHIHPTTIRLVWRCKKPNLIGAVTDSTWMAGLPPGIYEFDGEREVVVEEERAYLRQQGTLAGSVTTFNQIFHNLTSKWGYSLLEAVALCSTNPARQAKILDCKGTIERGKDADLVLLGDQEQVMLTMVQGQIVFRAG
jgi:N-acetylglucosamine-6-phosphate deacetylase